MPEFLVNMKLTYRTTVTVEAESAFEAKCKADALDLTDDGMAAAECSDWEVTSDPRATGE